MMYNSLVDVTNTKSFVDNPFILLATENSYQEFRE